MIRSLPQEELAERWKEIKPYIERAIAHGIGETSSHDMFVGAMNGIYECWEAFDEEYNTLSFGMARINQFENHSQLQIVTAAGDGWDEYGPEALTYAEKYAKAIGCKYVTIWGRLGWTKRLKEYGYNNTYTVMTKEII
jgi:hypothetical protein